MRRSLQPVLQSEQLRAGTPDDPSFRRVRVGRTEVLLARLPSGEVVAFGSHCPHQGTPLEDATFWDGKVRCRRHLYLYDPSTGENVLPTADTRPETLWKLKPGYLPTYPVEERDGRIWVDDTPNPPPPAWDPKREERPSAPAPAEPPAAAPPPGGPVEHPAETVVTRVGEELSLVLPTSPRPGHIWRVDAQAALVSPVAQRFQPGEHACIEIRLAVRAPGETTVRCTYATPWDSIPKEVRTFVVHIDPASP
ncbi:MAG: Rieske 2Fe-2S domain-containing protein [Acidimicrobiales bacterium]